MSPLGITTRSESPSSHAVGLRLRQRRVDPGLRQVHDGDDRRAHSDHFALPRRPHIHLAVDRRHHLRVALFDPRLFGQRARIRLCVARLVHGARRNLRQQLMRLRLPQRCLRCRQISLRRIHRGLAPPAGWSLLRRCACALMIPCLASATVRLVSACW